MSNPARQGRSRKLSARVERALKRLVMPGVYDTASEIARNTTRLGLSTAPANTIRRALGRQCLAARVKARAPALTKLQKRRRLERARHRHWTVTGKGSYSQTKLSYSAGI